MLKIFACAALLLTMAGCATTSQPPPAPVEPAAPMTTCERVASLLSNPWATPGQVAATLEIGHNNGCFAKKTG